MPNTMKASHKGTGKPQGQKMAPWAMRRGPQSGAPKGQTKTPMAVRRGTSTGGAQGQKSAPMAAVDGKKTMAIRSKAKIGTVGTPSMSAIRKSLRKTKGY